MITESIFPERLKIAVIKPLFKSGDRTNKTNYRPISLVNGFSKILEKVMAKQMIRYLETNNLLAEQQYGLRPQHYSCCNGTLR